MHPKLPLFIISLPFLLIQTCYQYEYHRWFRPSEMPYYPQFNYGALKSPNFSKEEKKTPEGHSLTTYKGDQEILSVLHFPVQSKDEAIKVMSLHSEKWAQQYNVHIAKSYGEETKSLDPHCADSLNFSYNKYFSRMDLWANEQKEIKGCPATSSSAYRVQYLMMYCPESGEIYEIKVYYDKNDSTPEIDFAECPLNVTGIKNLLVTTWENYKKFRAKNRKSMKEREEKEEQKKQPDP